MAGSQFNGFASTNQQCCLVFKLAKYLPCQADCREGNRNRTGPDRRVGTYLLGDRKRMLEQAVDQGIDAACLQCLLIAVLQLSQDLRNLGFQLA